MAKRTNGNAPRLAPVSSPGEPATQRSVPPPVIAPELVHTPQLIEQIRTRAYELYCERGYQNGNAERDWLKAEAEILARRNLAA